MRKITGDELIQEISEVLVEVDGPFLAKIANQVLSGSVTHIGPNENHHEIFEVGLGKDDERLTNDAKAYCKAVLSTWTSEKIVDEIETAGGEVSGNESRDDLMDLFIDRIEVYDIAFDFSIEESKKYPPHIQDMVPDEDNIWGFE